MRHTKRLTYLGYLIFLTIVFLIRIFLASMNRNTRLNILRTHVIIDDYFNLQWWQWNICVRECLATWILSMFEVWRKQADAPCFDEGAPLAPCARELASFGQYRLHASASTSKFGAHAKSAEHGMHSSTLGKPRKSQQAWARPSPMPAMSRSRTSRSSTARIRARTSGGMSGSQSDAFQ